MNDQTPTSDSSVHPSGSALFSTTRERFNLAESLVYLDGNSLGPPVRSVPGRVERTIREEWGGDLITSWTKHGWFTLARSVGDRIGRLIGAPADTVVAGDTISVNLFKVLGAAMSLSAPRKVILTDTGNFPSDLYVAQGLGKLLGDVEVRLVEPEAVFDSISDDIAVVMLTEVDYRTARLHDMRAINEKARKHGVLTVWDLAHSAGAIPVDLEGTGADFAVGCTYKYLNGGPGAPGFTYVRQGLAAKVETPIAGWWAHADPFAFDLDFRPAPGITGFQCGTQSILALVALDEALSVWDGIDVRDVRAMSIRLSEVLSHEVETRCRRHGLTLAGPRDFTRRGSHVSFHCPEGYAVMQALIARGVVGDFRAPDMIRFGITPLYIGEADVRRAAAIIAEVLDTRAWDQPQFRKRQAVT
ncbi:MAG: kynureninase [Hyphomicrobiales bacterium]